MVSAPAGITGSMSSLEKPFDVQASHTAEHLLFLQNYCFVFEGIGYSSVN